MTEKSSNEVLSEQLNEFFPDDSKPVIENEIVEEIESQEEGESTDEVEKSQETKEESQEESTEEVEEETETTNNEELGELDRRLSGHTNEFKDLVKLVKDKEIQAKILDAGKGFRATNDRLSLELGNLKKEVSNVKEFESLLKSNPALALKNLAKVTNVDLSTLVEKPVQSEDEYDYRTPEEIKRDKDLEDIRKELFELRSQKATDEHLTISQEVELFAGSKDEKGNLKYPHFDRLESSMFDILGLDKSRLGTPKTSQERAIRLQKAYEKALLLDDDLRSERDASILKAAQNKKLEEIERAKKLKKFSSKSSSASSKPASSRDAVSEAYDKWISNSL